MLRTPRFTLRHLAAFHATWWEHPRLRVMDWLPGFDEQAEDAQEQYAKAGRCSSRRLVTLSQMVLCHSAPS